MAIQIKDTPSLKGKDADSFFESIDKNESQKPSAEELAKIKASYDKISKLLKKSV